MTRNSSSRKIIDSIKRYLEKKSKELHEAEIRKKLREYRIGDLNSSEILK